MNEKELNPYELVHKVAKDAELNEVQERNADSLKKSNLIKTVNEKKVKRNYVLDSYLKFTHDKEVDK